MGVDDSGENDGVEDAVRNLNTILQGEELILMVGEGFDDTDFDVCAKVSAGGGENGGD